MTDRHEQRDVDGLHAVPHPTDDLAGWSLEVDSDESHDDRRLIDPDGNRVGTWREGYPYTKRMSRKEYERVKRSLQIELLKMQSWVKDTGQRVLVMCEGRDAAGKAAPSSASPST